MRFSTPPIAHTATPMVASKRSSSTATLTAINTRSVTGFYGVALKLVHQCQINLELKWLLRDLKPSHRTICYFRVNNGDAIKRAHRHFVKQLQNWKLISGQILALDSTKLRGQNSIKNNFNQKKINRHLEYIDHKIEEYLDTIKEMEESNSGKTSEEIENKIEILEKRR